MNPFKGLTIRQQLQQGLNLIMVVASAYALWKTGALILDTESPIVVVLTGSMEPLFYRGDILFLYNPPVSQNIKLGDITVFKLKDKEIPIVHRVVKVHHQNKGDKEYILTKGDNNPGDDRVLYAQGQKWLHREDIVGMVLGYVPYVGILTIWMNDYPILKFMLLAFLGLYTLLHREEQQQQ